jgi:TRAP-type C4-dicarboxylate transport system substrate-binding protein
MIEINWAPLVGACVVRKQTWEKIPAAVRAELLKGAAAVGAEIKANSRKESDESVGAMEKRGLKVTKVTPAIEAAWRSAAEAAYPKIRGAIVPPEIFDRVLELIKEYRAGRKN